MPGAWLSERRRSTACIGARGQRRGIGADRRAHRNRAVERRTPRARVRCARSPAAGTVGGRPAEEPSSVQRRARRLAERHRRRRCSRSGGVDAGGWWLVHQRAWPPGPPNAAELLRDLRSRTARNRIPCRSARPRRSKLKPPPPPPAAGGRVPDDAGGRPSYRHAGRAAPGVAPRCACGSAAARRRASWGARRASARGWRAGRRTSRWGRGSRWASVVDVRGGRSVGLAARGRRTSRWRGGRTSRRGVLLPLRGDRDEAPLDGDRGAVAASKDSLSNSKNPMSCPHSIGPTLRRCPFTRGVRRQYGCAGKDSSVRYRTKRRAAGDASIRESIADRVIDPARKSLCFYEAAAAFRLTMRFRRDVTSLAKHPRPPANEPSVDSGKPPPGWSLRRRSLSRRSLGASERPMGTHISEGDSDGLALP